MKKFLTVLAALAALCVSACLYETTDKVHGAVIPYISHVNGNQVASVNQLTYSNVTRAYGCTFSHRTGISTNLPLTVRVQTATCLNSSIQDFFEHYSDLAYMRGWTLFFAESTEAADPMYIDGSHAAVRLDLEFSADGGSTWTLIGRRRFADATQSSINGVIFGRDVLPMTFREGTVLKLRLVATEADTSSYGNYDYHDYAEDASWAAVPSIYGAYIFEVTVTISGNRRGGF
jgi:hypothetical protein